jgi:hypothetical protein
MHGPDPDLEPHLEPDSEPYSDKHSYFLLDLQHYGTYNLPSNFSGTQQYPARGLCSISARPIDLSFAFTGLRSPSPPLQARNLCPDVKLLLTHATVWLLSCYPDAPEKTALAMDPPAHTAQLPVISYLYI